MVRSCIDEFRSLSLEPLLDLLLTIEGKWRSLWGFRKPRWYLLMGKMMYIHTLILSKAGACCSCNLKKGRKDRMIEEGLMNRKKHPSRGRIWEFKDDIASAAKSLDVREQPLNKRSTLNYWKHNKMSLGTEKENTILSPPTPFLLQPVIIEPKKGHTLPSFFTERENLISRWSIIFSSFILVCFSKDCLPYEYSHPTHFTVPYSHLF